MSSFSFSKLPKLDQLVIARMDTRNEPFAIGVVVAEPTLRDTFDPPQRTHTLTLQRSESTGGAVRAAAAVSAPAVPARGAAIPHWEDLPLSQTIQLTTESFEVLVQWYDLQSDWVTKLRLLDDDHWHAEYAKRAAAVVAAQVESRPPSEDWIVSQYKAAVFLPKPGKAEEVQDTLAVASLIAWGARDVLLTAAGQLSTAAFEAVWRDLVEAQVPMSKGRQVVAASRSSSSSSSSNSVDDDELSDDGDSSVTHDGGGYITVASKKRPKKQDTATPKRRRTSAVARAAPASAPAVLAQQGKRSGRNLAAKHVATSANAESAAASSPAAAAAAAAAATAAATAIPAATITTSGTASACARGPCANCEEMHKKMFVLAREVHDVWRQLTDVAARAYQDGGCLGRRVD